jgi:hypothetical protein
VERSWKNVGCHGDFSHIFSIKDALEKIVAKAESTAKGEKRSNLV